jgi:hypothetical protein
MTINCTLHKDCWPALEASHKHLLRRLGGGGGREGESDPGFQFQDITSWEPYAQGLQP